MKILASRFELHQHIISLFESNNDSSEALKYFEFVGQNILWQNILNLMESGIPEEFLKLLLRSPKEKDIIVSASDILEENGKLIFLSEFILSNENENFINEPQIIAIKLKILANLKDERFLELIKDPKLVSLSWVYKFFLIILLDVLY